MRDKFNVKYGWARPDDIARKRVVSNSLNIHADIPNIEVRKLINETIAELVGNGILRNHNDVKQYLAQFGEITREGKDYVSVKLKYEKKAIKLKGAVYGRDFKLDGISEEVAREQSKRIETSAADRAREISRLDNLIEEIISERSRYNRSRYDRTIEQFAKSNDRSPTQDHGGREGYVKEDQGEQIGDRGRSNEPAPVNRTSESEVLDNPAHGRIEPNNWLDVGFVGYGGYYHRPQSRVSTGKRTDQQNKAEPQNTRDRDRGRLFDTSKRAYSADGLQHQRRAGSYQNDEVIDDTVRTRIEERIRASKAIIQRRINESHKLILEQLTEDRKRVSEDFQRSEEHYRTADSHTEQVRVIIEQGASEFRRSTATGIDEQVNTIARIAYGIREWLGKIGKSIQGVKDELAKMELFKSAKENVVSVKRSKINLSPRR